LILDFIPAYQYPSYIEEVRCLTNLQELQLSHPLSRDATRKEGEFPDLSELISLRKVILWNFDGDCTLLGLSSRMTNLRCLQLHDCLGLRKCDGVGDLVTLEDLQLESCGNLEKLPKLQKLTRLQTLNIQWDGRIAAIPGLDDLVSLEDLHLRWCVKPEKLPNLRKLTRLRTLVMTCCTLIEAIPGFEDLVALELLEARFCKNLTQALNLRKLTNLQELYLKDSPVDALVGLGDLVNLNVLEVNFAWLTEWYYYHFDLHKLTKLQRLKSNGWSLARFPCGVHLANLEHLHLFECRRVDELAGGLDAPRLQSLEIDDADFIDVSWVGSFIALRSLRIRACQKLEKVPDMHRLTRLELLEVINCRSLRGWNGVSRLSAGVDFLSQQILTAGGGACIPPQVEDMCIHSVSITEFPDLSNFPRLRLLSICDCQKLIRLTNSAPLSALEEIGLYDCGSLEELPDLSGSWRLRSLSVRGCGVEFTADETSMLMLMCPLVDVATTSSDSSESDESN
jgi:hypothetical protein